VALPSQTLTCAIITGTALAARGLLREHDLAQRAEGRLLWDFPDILPREAWLKRSWQECAWSDPEHTPMLLTRWQELALWQEAIESATRDILLDAHATARAATEAWGLLHAWEAPHDFAAFQATEDSAAFFAWMARVEQRLRGRDWITLAELPAALAQRAASGAWGVASAPALAGFDEISPADRRLFNAVGAREVVSASEIRGRLARVNCHDGMDELTRSAVWARRKVEANPEARIGIAVPDLAAMAATAQRIFEDILHPGWGFRREAPAFRISAGESLADAPMVSAALLILQLMEGVPREQAAMLWRSPFVTVPEGAQLAAELRRNKADPVTLRTPAVARCLPELAAAAKAWPERARSGQWSADISKLLGLAGFPGTRALAREEAETLEAWKDLLAEFARLEAVAGPLSRGSAISRIARMARASRVRPRGVPADASVEIFDVAEAAGVRFDGLWIAGLDAGAWPPKPNPNPFLPLAMQRAAGMPGSSADLQFRFAQRVIKRLCSSAPEVVCSFAAHAADEERQPSPLVAGLPCLPELPPADTAIRRVFACAPPMEMAAADERVAIAPGTLQRGGSQVLADQSACPFRAFAMHRLRARDADEPDVGLSPLERGSLAHRALEWFWQRLQTSERLQALTPAELTALIRSSAQGALEEYALARERSAALDRFCLLERSRLEGLLREWIEIEKKREPFTVVRSEKKSEVDVAGLRLELRVDRIDRYGDGTHAIVDYKTSKNLSEKMWAGERPEAPQLPLYATTSGVPVSEVAFGKLVTGSADWIGERGASLRELLPRWQAVVRKLAAEFLEGRAEVDPREDPSPCGMCALPALCRVQEIGRHREIGAAQENGDGNE